MSQSVERRGYRSVAASTGTVVGIAFNEAGLANEAKTDLETIFRAEYKRIARVIARVTRDPARAEELAPSSFRDGQSPKPSSRVAQWCCSVQ
jgi:hypothetical protein